MSNTQWALLDEDDFVAEVTDVDPAGRFHEALRWAPVPEALVGVINENYQYDGEGGFDGADYGGSRAMAQKAEASVRLKEIDADSARSLREIALGKDVGINQAKLAALDYEAQTLRGIK